MFSVIMASIFTIVLCFVLKLYSHFVSTGTMVRLHVLLFTSAHCIYDREAFVELKLECMYIHGHGVVHTLPFDLT